MNKRRKKSIPPAEPAATHGPAESQADSLIATPPKPNPAALSLFAVLLALWLIFLAVMAVMSTFSGSQTAQ